MNNDTTELCARIRERCLQRQWYGPDAEEGLSGLCVTADGEAFYDDLPERFRAGFIRPPLTEPQMQACEAQLGFSLPPLLRDLYMQVADGGFGPAWGINGLRDEPDDQWGGLVTEYRKLKQHHRLVSLTDLKKRAIPDHMINLPGYVWPERLLRLCNWGCGNYSSIDGRTGQILYLTPGQECNWLLDYTHASLGDWLEDWLAGTLAMETRRSNGKHRHG
jgi:hypothetical protein